MAEPTGLIWYVAYGSNLARNRFDCYLAGGTPAGALGANAGARDPSPPRAEAILVLPGQVYFASQSLIWGGGVAFYDHSGPGVTLARGYLLTQGQFSDLAAQEAGRPAGADLSLPTLVTGAHHRLGPGRYETAVVCGERDGIPMVTLTAPWSNGDVDYRSPSVAYLLTVACGLAESHKLTVSAQAAYLAPLPGIRPHWTLGELTAALAFGFNETSTKHSPHNVKR